MSGKKVKSHPLLMRPDLVSQSLLGIKTVTRRTDRRWLKAKAGENCWVRETWAVDKRLDAIAPSDVPNIAPVWWFTSKNPRRLNGQAVDLPRVRGKWRPNIFMPRWACRLEVKLTADPYLQRLHDMTEEDALAEGVEKVVGGFKHYGGLNTCCATALQSFRTLWRSIHGEASWQANPELVVIPYRRLAS